MKFSQLFVKVDGIWPFTESHMTVNWVIVEQHPIFADLKKTKQSTIWHKEGDAFTHTKLVAKAMEKLLKKRNVSTFSEYWKMMMAAALCHDLGKAQTTKWDEEKKDWGCKRHGAASARIIRTIFQDEDFELREKVCFMARQHMTLHHIFDKPERTLRALINLSLGPVTVEDMLLLKEADSFGSKNIKDTNKSIEMISEYIRNIARYHDCLDKPYQFKNDWHRLMFFAYPEHYATPDEIGVPEESYKTDFTVYMMLGVPGAGKDWYIEHNLADVPQLSRDLIRTEIGLKGEKPQGNKKEEEKVTEIFNQRMDEYLKNKTSFVINNTNGNKRYRDEFIKKILPHFARIVYVYCEAPSISENFKRRERMMPNKVITRMWNEFEFPYKNEYYDIRYNVQRSEEID